MGLFGKLFSASGESMKRARLEAEAIPAIKGLSGINPERELSVMEQGELTDSVLAFLNQQLPDFNEQEFSAVYILMFASRIQGRPNVEAVVNAALSYTAHHKLSIRNGIRKLVADKFSDFQEGKRI